MSRCTSSKQTHVRALIIELHYILFQFEKSFETRNYLYITKSVIIVSYLEHIYAASLHIKELLCTKTNLLRTNHIFFFVKRLARLTSLKLVSLFIPSRCFKVVAFFFLCAYLSLSIVEIEYHQSLGYWIIGYKLIVWYS